MSNKLHTEESSCAALELLPLLICGRDKTLEGRRNFFDVREVQIFSYLFLRKFIHSNSIFLTIHTGIPGFGRSNKETKTNKPVFTQDWSGVPYRSRRCDDHSSKKLS